MKYRYMSLLGLLFLGMQAAEADKEVVFTENATGTATLNVAGSTAVLLFFKRTDSSPTIQHAMKLVGEDVSLLVAAQRLLEKMRKDKTITHKKCMVMTSEECFSRDDFFEAMSSIEGHFGTFYSSDASFAECNLAVTYDGHKVYFKQGRSSEGTFS